MRDDFWLKRVAGTVAEALHTRRDGTTLRVQRNGAMTETYTGGWMVTVGTLGSQWEGVWLEVWLDRWATGKDRCFYAGFCAVEESNVTQLVEVSKKQWPVVLTFDHNDITDDRFAHLSRPLPTGKFNAPVREHYGGRSGTHFFGFYDRMKGSPDQVERRFCQQAVDFFLDVLHQLPESAADDGQAEVFPKIENRTLVRSHLTRERSRYLATQCKERDGYQCQVCAMTFEEAYGALGRGFAEAHHKTPLHELAEGVKTELEDLITVCANCHRMLHRMEGKPSDIKRLQAIVGKRRRGTR